MAVEKTTGDLLAADVDALVNTVNCVGVMGKGIALQFKRRFPAVFWRVRRRMSTRRSPDREDACRADRAPRWAPVGHQLPDQEALALAIAP